MRYAAFTEALVTDACEPLWEVHRFEGLKIGERTISQVESWRQSDLLDSTLIEWRVIFMLDTTVWP